MNLGVLYQSLERFGLLDIELSNKQIWGILMYSDLAFTRPDVLELQSHVAAPGAARVIIEYFYPCDCIIILNLSMFTLL